MFRRASRNARRSFSNDAKHSKRFNTQTGKKLEYPIKRGQQSWSQ